MKGHVRRRRGRYTVVLELDHERDPETGEVVRRRKGLGQGFRTKAQADAALRDALERARHGWRGPTRISLADFLADEWLPAVEISLAPTTAALYRTLLNAYVIPRLGGRNLDTLATVDLTRLYADLLRSGGRGGRREGRADIHGGRMRPVGCRHSSRSCCGRGANADMAIFDRGQGPPVSDPDNQRFPACLPPSRAQKGLRWQQSDR